MPVPWKLDILWNLYIRFYSPSEARKEREGSGKHDVFCCMRCSVHHAFQQLSGFQLSTVIWLFWRCKGDKSVYCDIPTAVAVMIWLYGPGRNIFMCYEYLNLLLLRLYWWEFKGVVMCRRHGVTNECRNPNSNYCPKQLYYIEKMNVSCRENWEQTLPDEKKNWNRSMEAFCCCNWRKPLDQKLVWSASFHLSFHILNIHCWGWCLFCQL